METQIEIRNSFKLLLICSAASVLLWFIPFAGILTYPFRIFVTLVHETGHALAALATLGHVYRIQLDWGGSGVTETSGGVRLLVSSAGYLGATAYGAALLLFLRRPGRARSAALISGAMALLITVFFGGNLAAWVVGLFFGVGLIVMALKASPRFVHFFMSFLAIQAVLNAFYDLRTLMYLSAFEPSRPTDAQNMAIATNNLIPAVAWSLGWGLMSLALLGGTLAIYYRSLRATPGAVIDAPPLLTKISA